MVENAYPVPLTHFRAEGVFGTSATTPVESWSFGFHLGGAALEAGYAASLPAAWTAVAAYIANTTGGAIFSSDVFLTEIMAAEMGTDGKLVQGEYTRFSGTAAQGQSNDSALNYDDTSAVTLDAGTPAKGRFNRFYPPPQTGSITLGRLSAAAAAGRATAAKNMLAGVQNAFEFAFVTQPAYGQFWSSTIPASTVTFTHLPVVVASKRWGTLRPVAAVKVGRVVDSQRRRRRSLIEDYQPVALPLPT